MEIRELLAVAPANGSAGDSGAKGCDWSFCSLVITFFLRRLEFLGLRLGPSILAFDSDKFGLATDAKFENEDTIGTTGASKRSAPVPRPGSKVEAVSTLERMLARLGEEFDPAIEGAADGSTEGAAEGVFFFAFFFLFFLLDRRSSSELELEEDEESLPGALS